MIKCKLVFETKESVDIYANDLKAYIWEGIGFQVAKIDLGSFSAMAPASC